MKKPRLGLAVSAVVGIIVLVLVGVRINQGIKSRGQAVSQMDLRPRMDPISVQVELVSRGTVEEVAVLSGSLEPLPGGCVTAERGAWLVWRRKLGSGSSRGCPSGDGT